MTYIPTGRELIDPFAFLENAGIRTGMKVADFGCGNLGHYVFPAGQLVGPEGRVYAIDILKSVLDGIVGRIKMEQTDNIETLWGDIEKPKGVRIADKYLDMVILANNLFLSKQKPAMLKECARVLKPGGILAIAEWKATGISLGPKPEDLVPEAEAIKLAKEAGLKLESEFLPGKYHYGLVCSR